MAEPTTTCLPLYSQDYDADYPPEARALKEAISASDAVLFVTPEYNRSIPGGLKNAIDWASRPWGQDSFSHSPAGVGLCRRYFSGNTCRSSATTSSGALSVLPRP
jgi:NAD(P)H-dependent FMN reductase